MNANTEHINIFIAYSRKDEEYLKRLRISLKLLQRRYKNLNIWYDGEIHAGDDWDKTIKGQLKKADIVLLLLSIDSLSSDYFYEEEVRAARARHEAGQTIVIPVILRPCPWKPEFGDLQALPNGGKPLTKWQDIDEAYTNIVEGVEQNVNFIRSRRKEKVDKIAALPIPIKELLHDMIYVRGGTFQMGSNEFDNEKPVHRVTLDDFKIGKYPITQAQYQAVMGENPSHFKGNDKRPVECVSWNDAQDFIQKLNDMTYENFRLPTEAEWEFAAKGGMKSEGFKYAGSSDCNNVAWHYNNSNVTTHPVGEKTANELNIHDMNGNVREWCEDWYDENYYKNSPEKNPKGPTSEQTYRVLRGGSWFDFLIFCRVTSRGVNSPNSTFHVDGFRLAQTP